MDDFTTRVVTAALDDLTAGTSKLPTVSKVKSRAWFLYVQWRDAFLESRVDYVLERVPTWKLIALLPCLIQLLAYRRELWETPITEEDDELEELAAWTLVTVQWLNREARGLAPTLHMNDDAVKAQIDLRRPPVQLTLF